MPVWALSFLTAKKMPVFLKPENRFSFLLAPISKLFSKVLSEIPSEVSSKAPSMSLPMLLH